MLRIVVRGAFVIVLSMLMFGFFSCQKEVQPAKRIEHKVEETPKKVTPKPKEVTETPSQALKVSEHFEALITFLSGDVYVSRGNGKWEEANIGESLDKGDSLKVGEDSYCEIQFGNTATIRVQQNTEVSLKDVLLQVKNTKVKVALGVGAVLCKVRKLSKNDRFKVQTPSVVCGVRGTQFGVKFSKTRGTTVAVRKGKVAVLPSALDVDVIKEKLKDKPKELLTVIEKVREAAPVVVANQELKVSNAVIEKKAKTFEKVVNKITQLAVKEKTMPSEKIKEVTKLVSQTVKEVKKEISRPVKISKETLEELKPVEAIKIIELPLPQENLPSAPASEKSSKLPSKIASKGKNLKEEEKKPALSLEKIGIQVEPKDAEIILNGNPVGKGTFFGLFKSGENLVFTIKREGFVSKELRISVVKGASRNYHIRLKEKKERIEVNVTPADAKILINGKEVSVGSFSGEFEWGKKLSIVARKPGYVEKTLNIEVEKGSGGLYNLTLREKKETISFSVEPSDAEIFINGSKVGTGFYSGKFDWGQTLSVVARKEGYNEKSMELVLTEGSGRTYNLVLKREEERVSIKTVPRDAEIVIDGKVVGRGNYASKFVVGTKLIVEIRKEDYVSKKLEIEVKKGGKREYSVVIKPKVIPFSYSVAGNKLVGGVVAFRNLIVTSDNSGVLYAVDKNGRIVWQVATKNSPNVNSFPQLIGNRIFFSGSSEFVIVNPVSGMVDFREGLLGTSSHMFGRHVVGYDGKILFPTDDKIKIINGEGKPIKEIKIPGGSKMTPTVYKDSVLVVNQRGIFYRINLSSGKIVARLKTKAIQPVAIAVTVHGNRGFFSGRRGMVVCVDLTKNKILWQRKPAGAKSIGVFQDLEYGDGGIFMFAKSSIYAFKASNGSALFPPIRGISAPPLYHNGYLYTGKNDGRFVIIKATTGKVVKSLKIKGIITTRPQFIDGKVVVGTENGEIIGINPKGIE